MFTLSCTSDKIWNLQELVAYLSAHQRRDIEINLEPEAICLENLGLYKILDQFEFNSVSINTWNPLEFHHRYNVVYKGNNFWFNHISNNLKIPFTNTHSFLCLYHRPTAGRLGLASYLNKNYKDQSIIHFSAKTNIDNRVHFELDKLLMWDLQSIVNVGELLPSLPILQSSPDRYTPTNGYDYSDPLTDLYQNIFVDVVVESHVAGNTFFPTEKTVRPILLERPFIVFGSKNYLLYLRQMGFKTFWQYWDEDYDSHDGKDRLLKMYQVIDYIASLTSNQRLQLFEKLKPILDYNRDLLVSKKWFNEIQLINE